MSLYENKVTPYIDSLINNIHILKISQTMICLFVIVCKNNGQLRIFKTLVVFYFQGVCGDDTILSMVFY